MSSQSHFFAASLFAPPDRPFRVDEQPLGRQFERRQHVAWRARCSDVAAGRRCNGRRFFGLDTVDRENVPRIARQRLQRKVADDHSHDVVRIWVAIGGNCLPGRDLATQGRDAGMEPERFSGTHVDGPQPLEIAKDQLFSDQQGQLRRADRQTVLKLISLPGQGERRHMPALLARQCFAPDRMPQGRRRALAQDVAISSPVCTTAVPATAVLNCLAGCVGIQFFQPARNRNRAAGDLDRYVSLDTFENLAGRVGLVQTHGAARGLCSQGGRHPRSLRRLCEYVPEPAPSQGVAAVVNPPGGQPLSGLESRRSVLEAVDNLGQQSGIWTAGAAFQKLPGLTAEQGLVGCQRLWRKHPHETRGQSVSATGNRLGFEPNEHVFVAVENGLQLGQSLDKAAGVQVFLSRPQTNFNMTIANEILVPLIEIFPFRVAAHGGGQIEPAGEQHPGERTSPAHSPRRGEGHRASCHARFLHETKAALVALWDGILACLLAKGHSKSG